MKIYHLFYAVISDLAEAANLKQQQQKQTIKIRLETVTELKILFFGVDLHKTFSSYKGFRTVLPPESLVTCEQALKGLGFALKHRFPASSRVPFSRPAIRPCSQARSNSLLIFVT